MMDANVECTVNSAGHLVLTCDQASRLEIDEQLRHRSSDDVLWELFEPYWANSSYWPFDAGQANPFVGLTCAPCIAEDMIVHDDGKHEIVGRCWWFPNYMVEDPMLTLAQEGTVTFMLAT